MPRWPRGIGVGIAAAIKLTPGVFVLLFLLRRDQRSVARAGLSFAACTGAAFALAPHDALRYWTQIACHADPQAPNTSEQVTGMPSLASTACTWSLLLVRSPTSLPVAGQLPQIADLRWGDPRLRQPAHPQQVSQVASVPSVLTR